MAAPKDTRAFEAAVRTLLLPLAAYAKANGIDSRRFRQLVARAASGRGDSILPALPYDAAVRLVSRWSMDRAYSRGGRPKALEFSGPGSFSSLVRSARATSPQRARQALLAAGLVKEDGRQRLHLVSAAYIPTAGEAENTEILGRAAADFFRVLTHNLSAPAREKFLQRVASYDNIGSSSLMTLRRALRREGLRALERANSLLVAKDRDRNPRAGGGRRTRVSFGVYLLETPVDGGRRRKR